MSSPDQQKLPAAANESSNGSVSSTADTMLPPDKTKHLAGAAAPPADEDRSLLPVIEALVFASDEPLTFKQIKDILAPTADEDDSGDVSSTGHSTTAESADSSAVDTTDSNGEDKDTAIVKRPPRNRRKKKTFTITRVKNIIDALNLEYENEGRAFRIIEVSGGFAYQTTSAFGEYVGKLFAERSRRRLTQSALETLSIMAFKQPISKPAIEAIRGVNVDYVVKSLLEKNLISIVGREDSVGRPLLYGTTSTFLKHFGLHSLNDLPKPREIRELLKNGDDDHANPIEELDPEAAAQLSTTSSLELERMFERAQINDSAQKTQPDELPPDETGELHIQFDSDAGESAVEEKSSDAGEHGDADENGLDD